MPEGVRPTDGAKPHRQERRKKIARQNLYKITGFGGLYYAPPRLFLRVTGSTYKSLLNALASGKAAQAKRALRRFIKTLEDAYDGLQALR